MKDIPKPTRRLLLSRTKIILGAVIASTLLCCQMVKAASAIANVYPNGTNMFQPSATLSFTASSSAGVSNVTVNLTVTSVYKGTSFLKVLTAANGLTITGPATSENVSAVLASNTLYSAVIQVTDTNGSIASQTVTFDTIKPALIPGRQKIGIIPATVSVDSSSIIRKPTDTPASIPRRASMLRITMAMLPLIVPETLRTATAVFIRKRPAVLKQIINVSRTSALAKRIMTLDLPILAILETIPVTIPRELTTCSCAPAAAMAPKRTREISQCNPGPLPSPASRLARINLA